MMSGYIDNARKNGMGKLPAFFATRAITSGIITKKKVMREVNAAIDLFVPEQDRKDKKKLRKIQNEVLYNRFVYMIFPDEYFLYHFSEISEAEKKEFIGEFERRQICDAVSDEEIKQFFKNKYKAYQAFKQYYRREVIQVETKDDHDTFLAFWNAHDRMIVKPINMYKGIGVHIIKKEGQDPEKVFEEILEGGTAVLEECIVQSESLGSFHPESVNTVRMAVWHEGDKVTPLFSVFRMGRGSSVVDNGGAGGCFATVDVKTGELITPAVSEDGGRFSTHPNSGKQIVGFVIPRWQELLDMVQEISRIIDQPYISWDLALTDAGWVIVEGNSTGQFLNQMSNVKGCRSLMEPYFKRAISKRKQNNK